MWTWTPPTPIPGLDTGVPVVGFEVESSWRTRKHVKGDLLNLQDAGVALGVIVLAGDGEKDDSLRRFANCWWTVRGPKCWFGQPRTCEPSPTRCRSQPPLTPRPRQRSRTEPGHRRTLPQPLPRSLPPRMPASTRRCTAGSAPKNAHPSR